MDELWVNGDGKTEHNRYFRTVTIRYISRMMFIKKVVDRSGHSKVQMPIHAVTWLCDIPKSPCGQGVQTTSRQ